MVPHQLTARLLRSHRRNLRAEAEEEQPCRPSSICTPRRSHCRPGSASSASRSSTSVRPTGTETKAARPIDGAHGVGKLRKIDCSGFVRNVYDEVFREEGLASRSDLNVAKFKVVDLFVDVTDPLAGDIICWNEHMGIVYDHGKKLFIHAPHTGDHVRVSSYWP